MRTGHGVAPRGGRTSLNAAMAILVAGLALPGGCTAGSPDREPSGTGAPPGRSGPGISEPVAASASVAVERSAAGEGAGGAEAATASPGTPRPARDGNRGPFLTYPSVSRDGSRLVCSVDATGDHEVWIHSFSDGSWLRLTENPARDTEPAFSPDGSHVAWVSDRDGNREIYMMKADGSKEVNLTLQPARDSYPAFSPDGARILFYSDRDGGIETLYFLDVATREVTPVPGVGPGPNHSASWAPDGSWIAYESRRDGRLQIYALDLRDRVERRLTSHDGEDLLPQISPDGSRIVSGSRRAGNEEIHVMNADGSGEINLTRGPSTDLAPRWSPDGAIVYVSDISGRWAFHLMRDDGRATGREPLSFPAGTR